MAAQSSGTLVVVRFLLCLVYATKCMKKAGHARVYEDRSQSKTIGPLYIMHVKLRLSVLHCNSTTLSMNVTVHEGSCSIYSEASGANSHLVHTKDGF